MMDQTRRSFLKTTLSASGALIISIALPHKTIAEEEKIIPFFEMDEEGNIIFINSRSDMGQGTATSMAMIFLDEMDADWDKLTSIKDGRAVLGLYGEDKDLITVGAVSTIFGWTRYRKEAARIREGFKKAAAIKWGVSTYGLKTEKSIVINPKTGKTISYHELIQDVVKLELPTDVNLKARNRMNIIGKPVKELRTKERVTGEAIYGIDIDFPELKIAVLARCPVFGGKVISYNDEKTRAIKGVVDVVEISNGVAVIANGFWAAEKGREALDIEWDYGDFQHESSATISNKLRSLHNNPADSKKVKGDAETELSNSENGQIVENTFSFPFIAHATMEPMNSTAWVTDEKCEIWAPTQSKVFAVIQSAKLLGRKNEDIKFNNTFIGGGFGRRAQEDFVLESVEISQKSKLPIKLIWTREDDMRHDYYRPMAEINIKAKLNTDGKISTWIGSIGTVDTGPYHFFPPAREGNGGKGIAIAGIQSAYDIDHHYIQAGYEKLPITVGILRGIAHGYTNFTIEVMVERLAKLAGRDPLVMRAEMLSYNKRAYNVISNLLNKDKLNPVAEGMARGYAFAFEGEQHIDYQYYSGHMADVKMQDDGTIKVHKIWVIADHGHVINPNGFRKQIESSIYFALSMLRSGKITIEEGRVEQSNFHDYPVSTIGQGPEEIDIEFIDLDVVPMGTGEKMQAGLQPAIANAIEKLTDTEISTIPIKNLA